MMILSTKAPVIAVSVEGSTPLCVDGRRLRTWAKGVAVELVTVQTAGGEWYPVETKPRNDWGSAKAEGLVELTIEQTPIVRSLRVVGRAGRCRTACTLLEMPRAAAVVAIREWARLSVLRRTLNLASHRVRPLRDWSVQHDRQRV